MCAHGGLKTVYVLSSWKPEISIGSRREERKRGAEMLVLDIYWILSSYLLNHLLQSPSPSLEEVF